MIASMDLFAFLTSICIVLITIVLCLSSYSNSTSELTKERRKTFQNNLYHNIIGFLPTQSSSKFNPQNKNYFKPKPKPKSNHFVSMQFFHDDFWEYERMKRFTKKQNKQASVSKQKKNWRLNALHKGTWNPMEWRSSSNVSNSNNSTFLVHDGTKNDNNYPIQAVNHVTMNNQSEPIMDSPLSNKNTNILHFCFLVHGYNGLSSDLAYLKYAIENVSESYNDDIIVHNVLCNEHKTGDGIEKGGDRIVIEIMDVIENTINEYTINPYENIEEVTLTFVGNSLGGLYARYAIAQIYHNMTDNDVDHDYDNKEQDKVDHFTMNLDNGVQVRFNTFYSIASPHLGVAKHTFVPIPRFAEIGIGYAMGQTGKDLFRINKLLWNMSTSETYLQPLRLFRKRTAYANTFHTDFPVPTKTAAFLHSKSQHPHTIMNRSIHAPKNQADQNSKKSMILASFYSNVSNQNKLSHDEKQKRGTKEDDLITMSSILDSLGWKKVFVDLRNEIPIGLNLSRIIRTNDFSSMMQILNDKDVFESKDLASLFASSKDFRFNLPLAHNLICAFSRDKYSTLINRGGRPVMDKLAMDLVDDIIIS